MMGHYGRGSSVEKVMELKAALRWDMRKRLVALSPETRREQCTDTDLVLPPPGPQRWPYKSAEPRVLLTRRTSSRGTALRVWRQLRSLPVFQSSKHIAVYLSVPGEVDTRPIVEHLLTTPGTFLPGLFHVYSERVS